jgi:hypothetical protein
MMNPGTQKRLDALVERAVQQYGEDSGEAESARRVAEGLAEISTHSGSDLDFLDSAQKNRVLTIERSQTVCESFCERFCTVDNPNLRAFHLTIAASREAQKVAADALDRLASWFTSEPDGAGPLGETHNPDRLDSATAPVVYATSRPGERWLIGPSQSFESIAEMLKTDGHCDFSEPPFSTNLQRHRMSPAEDCVKKLADLVRCYFECVEMNIEPAFLIAELVSVAFGNQVVFLRFCTDHFYGFYRKYQIDRDECEIIEPFEGIGNYW